VPYSRNSRPFFLGSVVGVGKGRFVFAAGAVVALTVSRVLAGPENARVVRGKVHIDRSGDVTTITAGRNSIIDYSSFGIGANETVRFIQPGSKARVLNRITGNTPSRIEGALTANGIVYLVNPAGIVFGPKTSCAGSITSRGSAAMSSTWGRSPLPACT
jgi:filamentous hemagglutinin family protein